MGQTEHFGCVRRAAYPGKDQHMIRIISESGDRFYLSERLEELLNEGWEIVYIHPASGKQGYETTAYLRKTVGDEVSNI